MRKLGSEKEIERKRKRNTLIISVFVLAVLVLGTVGYGFVSGPGFADSTDENSPIAPHGTVTSYGNKWIVSVQGQNFQFSNNPRSINNTDINVQATLNDFIGQPLYLAVENDAVALEIGSTLGKYASRAQLSCYGSCQDPDLPEKDCSTNLIVWQDSTENKVYQNESCIFIEGDMETVDAFLFKIFNV